MVTTLEWILVALIAVGILPAWLFGIAAFISARRPAKDKPSERYLAYVALLDSLHRVMATGTVENGAAFAASVRELRAYAEYSDLSLLYLEEINITGSNKFDHIMSAEMKATEAFLLELRNA